MRPMKPVSVDRNSKIPYPVHAQPKIDGIRAVVYNGKVLSNSLKLIPNEQIQRLFGRPEYEGFDGELTLGEPFGPKVFELARSFVMTKTAESDKIRYNVFDLIAPGSLYVDRLANLVKAFQMYKWNPPAGFEHILPVRNAYIFSQVGLDLMVEECLQQGYEGVILRNPDRFYKYGRSTLNEFALARIKPTKDAEAKVIGFQELQHNDNPAELSALGLTERAHRMEFKFYGNTLGALWVEDLKSKVVFKIGTGFTQKERDEIWGNKKEYIDKILTYKYQEIGMKDAPRAPVFLRWRPDFDVPSVED